MVLLRLFRSIKFEPEILFLFCYFLFKIRIKGNQQSRLLLFWTFFSLFGFQYCFILSALYPPPPSTFCCRSKNLFCFPQHRSKTGGKGFSSSFFFSILPQNSINNTQGPYISNTFPTWSPNCPPKKINTATS